MSESNAPRKLSKGKIALIALAAAAVIAALAFWLTADSRAYSRGVELQEAGAYSEAIAVLETIPDYKDARERINACSYAIALAQEKAGSYAEAQAAFAALGEYEDAAAHASECGYRLASELEMSGGAREAEEAFTALGSYKDSPARAANLEVAQTRYNVERERVESQVEALTTALAAGEVLLSEGETPLDAATEEELRACVEAGAALDLTLPEEPRTLSEAEEAADALTKIDVSALAERAAAAVAAYTDSVARYELVDAPTAEFVADRLSRVPEIARVVIAGEVEAGEDISGEAPADESALGEAGEATDEAASDEPAGDGSASGEADTVEAETDEAASGEAGMDETGTDDATSDEAAADEAGTDEVAAGEVISDETVSDETTVDETASDEAASDEAATDETASDKVAADETETDEITVDEVAVDETATDEAAAGEVVSDETVSDETTADEAGTDETASDEAVVDEAETDEAAVDETASDEATSDAVVTDETTVDEAATDAAATDEAATDAAATDEAGTDAAASDEAATDEAGTDEVAAGEVVSDEVASDEATSDEVGTDEAASDKVDADEAETDESVADESTSDETASDEATAGENAATEAASDENAPVDSIYFASTLVSEACVYLSDEALATSDAGCGGGVEIYATAEAAQRRDAELSAQAGQGAHRVAGTVVIRLSSALSAQERETLMEEVLEALTTAQPGESVALSESPQRLGALLTVGESGFVMDGDRLYYALTLVNDTESLTLEFPRVRVTFYDAQGEVVASDESVRMALCPGQELAWASDIWNIEEAPVSMEAELVQPRSRDFIDDSALCAPLEVRSAAIEREGEAATLVCELYNPNDFDAPSAAVTILYRDEAGALTAGETEWCGAIPAGEAIPFEMPLVPALIQETFEVHASLN